MTVNETPWEPPLAGTEVEHLVGALDRLRATFRWKADGLDHSGLQVRVGASALTLGGLLKHLAAVEDYTFTRKLRGEPLGAPWEDYEGEALGVHLGRQRHPGGPLRALGRGRRAVPARLARHWPPTASTSPPTSPCPTAGTPACAGSSAT